MSKQIEAKIRCPQCGNEFNAKLYRTVWVEYPDNRSRVLNDDINAVTCPACRKKTRLEFPFLCTNIKRGIAIWYEPYHDPEIDKDIAQYAAHFGPDSFYAKAPRIQDWEEFKGKLLDIEAASNGSTPQLSVSPAMKETFSGFLGSLGKETSKQGKYYPWWLSRLQSVFKRFKKVQSPLPSPREKDHKLGIKVVYDDLLKEGYKIEAVNTELGKLPQIVASFQGKLFFVIIITVRGPLPALPAETMHATLVQAEKHSAVCMFAPVALMSTGERDASGEEGFYVNYRGFSVV